MTHKKDNCSDRTSLLKPALRFGALLLALVAVVSLMMWTLNVGIAAVLSS